MKKDSDATIKTSGLSTSTLPALVYGLDGICKLFNVSRTTAWRMRHGIIKDACTQKGNNIIVNVKLALELFGVSNIAVSELPSDI